MKRGDSEVSGGFSLRKEASARAYSSLSVNAPRRIESAGSAPGPAARTAFPASCLTDESLLKRSCVSATIARGSPRSEASAAQARCLLSEPFSLSNAITGSIHFE